MAQFQKDEVRESILDSAREEFLEHGYESSSMRRIALKSKMTVGNLYRYFKNKEELSTTIVSPTYDAIDRMVSRLTGGTVHLGGGAESFSASIEQLKEMLSSLSDGLVDIYREHRTEVKILMMGSRLNKELTGWFSKMIAEQIEAHFPFEKNDARVRTLSDCYAGSIFGGIKTILASEQFSDETLKSMVRIYLNSYLLMLDQDLTQLA